MHSAGLKEERKKKKKRNKKTKNRILLKKLCKRPVTGTIRQWYQRCWFVDERLVRSARGSLWTLITLLMVRISALAAINSASRLPRRTQQKGTADSAEIFNCDYAVVDRSILRVRINAWLIQHFCSICCCRYCYFCCCFLPLCPSVCLFAPCCR